MTRRGFLLDRPTSTASKAAMPAIADPPITLFLPNQGSFVPDRRFPTR
jgi:hypothetical protein